MNIGGKGSTGRGYNICNYVNILVLERAWPFQGTEKKGWLPTVFLLVLGSIPAPGTRPLQRPASWSHQIIFPSGSAFAK